jgi:hypothetical protein
MDAHIKQQVGQGGQAGPSPALSAGVKDAGVGRRPAPCHLFFGQALRCAAQGVWQGGIAWLRDRACAAVGPRQGLNLL